MKLHYSQEAVDDLIRLRTFIAEKDSDAAARTASDLLNRIDNISAFPGMGKAVALAPEPLAIRDAIFGKYIVRYVVQAESLIILRVWHHFESR